MQQGERIGAYLLQERIASKPYAQVWSASDSRSSRMLALHFLADELCGDRTRMDNFARDFSQLAALRHPGIVSLLEFEQSAEHPFFTSELSPGEDMRQFIAHRPKPSVVLQVLRDLARSLEYAHSRGLIHRDIQPASVLFLEDGRVALGDFGIARALDFGVALGTDARYLSPEQAKGQSLDHRCDLYALGLLMFEGLTGRLPFQADSDFRVAMLHIHGALPQLPPQLAAYQPVLAKLLAKEPSQRFANAAEVVAALETLLQEPVQPTPQKAQRSRAEELVSAIEAREAFVAPALSLGAQPKAGDDGAQQRLKDEIKELKKSLEESRTARSALEQRQQDADAELEAKRQELARLDRDRNEAQEQLEQARREAAGSAQAADELERAALEDRRQLAGQAEKLEALEAQRSSLAEELKGLEALREQERLELEESRSRMIRLVQELDAARTRCDELSARLEAVEGELQWANARLASKEEETLGLSGELEAARKRMAALEEESVKVKDTLAKVEAAAKELIAARDEAERQARQARGQLETLRTELDDVRRSAEQGVTDGQRMRKELQASLNETQQLRTQLDQLKGDADQRLVQLQQELEQTRDALAEALQKMESAANQREIAQQEVQRTRQELEKLRSELAETGAKAALEESRARLDEALERQQLAAKKLASAIGERDEAASLAETLEEELSGLRSQLFEVENARLEAQKQAEALQSRMSDALGEAKNLEESDLALRLREAQDHAQQAEEQRLRLHREAEQSLAQQAELEKQLTTLEDETVSLRLQLAEAQNASPVEGFGEALSDESAAKEQHQEERIHAHVHGLDKAVLKWVASGVVLGVILGIWFYALLRPVPDPGAAVAAGVRIERQVAEEVRKGLELVAQARAEEAATHFRALIERYPARPEPYNNLAALYALQGRLEESKAVLEKALATDNNYATVYENLGIIYAEMARESYGKALRLEAQDRTPRLQLLAGKEPSLPEQARAAAPEKETPALEAPPASEKEPAELPSSAPAVPAAGTQEVETAALPASEPEPEAQEPAVGVSPEVLQGELDPTERELVSALNGWARAWSEQDVEGYLSHYSSDYRPPGGLSLREWQEQRRDRLRRPDWILVSLDDFQIVPTGRDRFRLKMTQTYRSDYYEDKTLKSINLLREDSGWKIYMERSLGTP